jgi:hypothetical protein
MASKPTLVGKKPKQFPPTATFDPPEKFLVQDSPANPRGALPFFEYWKSIAGTRESPKERADLITCKFYLHVPVVNYKLVDAKRKDSVFAAVEGPLWFEDPEDFETEVPKRFGAARWHVLLNEAGVHGELMHAYFGAGNLDDYPLMIDLRTLMRNDPKNEEYLKWLQKTRTPTPWDNPKNEDDEMANDALGVMADQMSRITEKVLDSKDRETEAKIRLMEQEQQATREQSTAPKPQTLDATVADRGLELFAHAANRSIDMVVNHAGSQLNTVEVMKTAAELFRPQSDTSGITLLVDALKDQSAKMLDMQKENQEFLRGVIGLRKNQDGSWSQGEQQSQSGGFEHEVTRFQRMADIFGYRKPGEMIVHPRREENHEPPPPPEKSFWAGVAENPVAFITGATTIVTLLANIIYNVMAKDKPMAPQEALQRAQQQQQPPQQPGQPVQQRPPQNVNLKDPSVWVDSIRVLEPTIKAHFQGKGSGLSGFSFAEYVLSNATGGGENQDGRRKYMMFKEHLGPGGFDVAVKMVPSLAEVVNALPQAWQVFLGEFFSYDELEPVADTAKVA